MTSKAEFVLYGAYGYTGDLIARLAAARGRTPLLAGRDPVRLKALGAELSLPWEAFDLTDPTRVAAGLAAYPLVLHCAGPFTHTAAPMARACLETGTHYLDITGEADVFLSMARRGARAAEAGVMLLPGVGFDVVPSDCLAKKLAERMPDARDLVLAFQGDSGPSHGTALTMIEHLHQGGLVRRGGELRRVPIAWKTRSVDFGQGPTTAVSIPWGDVVTAWYSTGIPDITVYMAVPPGALRTLKFLRWVRPVTRFQAVKNVLRRRVKAGPPGPSDRRLERGETRLWGSVTAADGRTVEERSRGPQAYRWTALTALAAVQRVLDGEAKPGFQTPSTAFGSGFVDATREE